MVTSWLSWMRPSLSLQQSQTTMGSLPRSLLVETRPQLLSLMMMVCKWHARLGYPCIAGHSYAMFAIIMNCIAKSSLISSTNTGIADWSSDDSSSASEPQHSKYINVTDHISLFTF